MEHTELEKPAALQLRHNNSEGFVYAYEKGEMDRYLSEVYKVIDELKSDIADLRDDKKSTDAILDERNAELAKLQAIIDERDKTIEELKEDYSSLKSEASDLQRRVYAANRDARRTRY